MSTRHADVESLARELFVALFWRATEFSYRIPDIQPGAYVDATAAFVAADAFYQAAAEWRRDGLEGVVDALTDATLGNGLRSEQKIYEKYIR